MRRWLFLFCAGLAAILTSAPAQPADGRTATRADAPRDDATLRMLHDRLARSRSRLLRLHAEFSEAMAGSSRVPREIDRRGLATHIEAARVALGPHNLAQAVSGLARVETLLGEIATAQNEFIAAEADVALLRGPDDAAARRMRARLAAAGAQLVRLFGQRPIALEARVTPDAPAGDPIAIKPVRPLRLWVRTAAGLEPATRVVEGLPMVADISFLEEPARALEVTFRSGENKLALAARPFDARETGATEDAGDLWRNVARTPEFVVSLGDALGVDLPPAPASPEEPGRAPAAQDWATLAGLWRTVYRDALLGSIEGWAQISPEGRVSIRYEHPTEPGVRQLQLASGEIRHEGPAPDSAELSHAPARKWRLTLRGRGIEPPPAARPSSSGAARLMLDARSTLPSVRFEGEQVDGTAEVERRRPADRETVRLDLAAAEGDSMLEWNWSYRADRATGRDAAGGGRAGLLLPPDPEDATVAPMAGREVWLRAMPQIVSALCLDDQVALEKDQRFDDRPVERYRFAPRTRTVPTGGGRSFVDTLGRSGNLTRRIFVLARGLPPSSLAPLNALPDENQAVQEYRILSRGVEDDAGNSQEMREAWTQFRRRVPRSMAAVDRTEEGVLVLAIIRSGAAPGYHPLLLNGARASWRLLYGDCIGSLQAVRVLATGGAGEADELEATPRLFMPERFRIAIQGMVTLPRDTITVAIKIGEQPAEFADGGSSLTLRRDPNEPTRFVSGDIELVRPEDLEAARRQQPDATIVAVRRGAKVRVFPEYDPGFLVLPASLDVSVFESPDRVGRLWKTEVEKAARLAGRTIDDWNAVMRGEASAATNVILTEWAINSPLTGVGLFRTTMEQLTRDARKFGITVPLASWWQRSAGSRDGVRQISISIGDHAAMLLLRREFIGMMQEHYADWQKNRASEVVRAIYAAQQSSVAALRSPLSFSKLPVRVLPGFGGRAPDDTCFLHQVFDDDYVNDELGVHDKSAIERLRWAAFSHAYQAWGEAMQRAMNEASSIPETDIPGLLKLTGHGFEAVVPRLLPQLLKLRDDETLAHRVRWEPDRVARAYVASLKALGAAVRAQESYSAVDSSAAWAAASIASMPLGGVGFWGAMAALSISAMDLAHTLYSDWWLNDARERELAFEVGAGAVLGYRRATEVNDTIVRGWRQALSIGGSLLGVGFDGFSAFRAVRALKAAEVLEQGTALARNLDFASPGALRALTPEQRALLIRFAEQAQDALRAAEQALSPAQLRVLENKAALDALVSRGADAVSAVGRPGMAAIPAKPRAIGTAVDTPNNWVPVPRQVNDNTCGVSVVRSMIERLTGRLTTEAEIVGRSLASGRGYKTSIDLANGRLADGGAWPAELIEMLDDAGIASRVPFARKFRADGLVPEGGLRVRPEARTIAPDPALERLAFTLDDAARELREGNQVLGVVDYLRRGGAGESPHWVIIERIGNGPVTRNGRQVFNGPYVIIGDPAHGKSVVIPRDDFLKHWKPEASVIAMPPGARNPAALAPPTPLPPRISPPATPPAGVRPGGAPGYLSGSDPLPHCVSDARSFLHRADPGHADARVAALIDACDAYLVRVARGLDPTTNRVLFNELVELLEDLSPNLVTRFVRRLEVQSFNGCLFLGGRVVDYVPAGLDFPTTTNALREFVRTLEYRDPLKFMNGKGTPPPLRGRFQADHILPVAWIVNRSKLPYGLKEFSLLKREFQIEVIQNPRNFQPLTPEMNRLKSDHSLDDWNRAVRAQYGESLSRDYLRWLEVEQEALRKVLQDQIDALLRRQAAEARPRAP